MRKFPTLFLALFLPVFASADITIAGYITEDMTLSPENGVVIVGPGVSVMPGVTLTIEPGTILKAGPSSPGMVFWLEILGTLVAEGTTSEPIYFTSMRDDSIGGDTNRDGDSSAPQTFDWMGILFQEGSVGSIKYSTLRYAGGFSGSHQSGLSNLGGSVSIENSSFENNFQSDILQSAGSLTVASSTFDRDNIAIRITGGNLVATPGNSLATTSSVENLSTTEVDMRNNWWGSETGPQPIDKVGEAEGSFIYGPILYEPWLLAPPGEEVEECCSSVIFLPGIKGSVLIKRSLLNDVPNDQLWPSSSGWNDDMAQLDLGQDGEGDAKIVVGGIVESYLGVDIYSSFADFMDELVSGGLINEWLPRSYDWRFSPEKILADGVKTESETIDIIEEIEQLASSSQTGQVTIVAHSMGGLMGKAIIKELEEQGKDSLIDSFVMVGTPQLGTPEAVAVLLHGHEDFAGRFLFNQVETRKTGRNMPSAYNLLPSPEYFTAVLDPVITFDTGASFTEGWRDEWGNEISNYPGFASFLTGGDGLRGRPDEDDLLKPEALRNDLVEGAEDFHSEFDNYQLPEHIRVVQVAGWGIPTIKSINYRNRHFVQSYESKFTTEGDGTVVYKSGLSQTADETYYFDLYVFNALENEPNSRHRNLTSAAPVQSLMTSLVNETAINTNEFIRTTKPDLGNVEDKLIVSAHSPVVLGVYDELGNFTGIDPNQDLSGDTAQITENIAGSTYLYFGENQYIFLPKAGLYNFVYTGIGNGSTTIEIKDFTADVVTPITAYSDIPTTESTTATFNVDSQNPDTTIIKLDMDNDGELDEIIVSDDADIFDLLNLLRDKIKSSNIKEKLKANLLKKIDNLERKIEKKVKNNKPLDNLKKRIEGIIKRVIKKEERGVISETDANEIVKLLEQIESGL